MVVLLEAVSKLEVLKQPLLIKYNESAIVKIEGR
jgi:hypothetical protein